MLERRNYDRTQLYNEVWKEPVSKVAKRYGVSDVALAKVCRSLEVPLPGRGYWAQLRAGRPVERTPLSETSGRKQINVPVYEYDVPKKTPFDSSLNFMDAALREKIIASCVVLQVNAELSNPHRLIRSTMKWEKSNHRSTTSPQEPVLAYRLSDNSKDRAFRILDCIFKQLEQYGYKVLTEHPLLSEQSRYGDGRKRHIAHVVHGNAYVSLNIKERMHPQLRPSDTKLIPASRGRKEQSPQLEQVLEYSGELMFWIGDFYSKFCSWNDTKHQTLEEKVGEIVITVMEAVQVIEIARAERIQREEDARLQAIKDYEFRERQRAEVKKVKRLLADAENYRASQMVHEYIRALGGYGDTDNHAMHRYIEWAKYRRIG